MKTGLNAPYGAPYFLTRKEPSNVDHRLLILMHLMVLRAF